LVVDGLQAQLVDSTVVQYDVCNLSLSCYVVTEILVAFSRRRVSDDSSTVNSQRTMKSGIISSLLKRVKLSENEKSNGNLSSSRYSSRSEITSPTLSSSRR
jgi:hypothetical protein